MTPSSVVTSLPTPHEEHSTFDDLPLQLSPKHVLFYALSSVCLTSIQHAEFCGLSARSASNPNRRTSSPNRQRPRLFYRGHCHRQLRLDTSRSNKRARRFYRSHQCHVPLSSASAGDPISLDRTLARSRLFLRPPRPRLLRCCAENNKAAAVKCPR